MSMDFLISFGFSADPFSSTNAADEPLIGEYFVDPPFFPAVIGDPNAPKSNVVFAPRGGGKTAQKIMIEKRSIEDGRFLCISYDRFPSEKVPTSGIVTAEYHLTNMSRALLLAILIDIENDKFDFQSIEKIDRNLLVSLSRELLGNISSEKFKESLNSIKSNGDKINDIWNKYGGLIVGLINSIAKRFELGKLEVNKNPYTPIDETIRFKFENLILLAQKIGYKSVYILVDRVDELMFTANNAEKAFAFLSTILIDLPLLETPGLAFKFFLWDQMKESYAEAGGRSDRLLEYSLDWSIEDLGKVLGRRLETYSGGKVTNFDQLLSADAPYDVHKLIVYFAHNSPRDMIRICKKIVDEHTRTGRFSEKIDFKTVKSALLAFSTERARELYGAYVSDLRKVGDLNFTIGTLANDVFRVSQQAARSKVQKWQGSGAVVKIGDVPNPGNRPQYLYGIVDPRLAVAVLSDASIDEAVEHFLIICPHCKGLRIASEGDITCPDCQGNFDASQATTLGKLCRKD